MFIRKITSFILTIILVLSMLSVTSFAGSEKAQPQNEVQIKNIIFMIPDGGGDTLMDLADMVKQAGGFDRTKYPNATITDTKPLTLLSYLAGFETTRSANSSVTDSAAGGTALSSGYKTNNGYIGVDTKKVPKATILEVAQSLGKATGIVSTAEWPHATPASYTAHAESRNDYYNIYKQIENKELNVVLGAAYGKVTEFEGATLDNARNAGYKIIRTPQEAASVQPGDKVWGNVGTSSLPMDIQNPADKASLPELTKAAITALSADPDGFFLMVEGSWVDSGGHNSNAVQTTSEYLAFDESWKVAVEFAKGRNDTIVIGAPDHDTGGMDFPSTMTNEIDLIRVGTNPSTFTWTGNGNHTGRNCPVWAYIPEGVEMLEGLSPVVGDSEDVRKNYIIDNTDFAHYLAYLMGTTMDAVSKELFVDVTSIGAYMPTTNRFVFNNGDKYIYTNTDTYYKDGVAVDMHGKVGVYLGGKFYVPAEMIDEEDWDYVNTEEPDKIEGSGTSADPYVIDSITDYKEFLVSISKGESATSGKYFRQACDIVLDSADYACDGKLTFAGTYDGNGHTITFDNVETAMGIAAFPNVTGTVVNLGVEGKIISSASAACAGIAYKLSSSGKIVNCYSSVDFDGNSFFGITTVNEGTIHNTYYGGKAKATSGNALSEGGKYVNCYYINVCGLTQTSAGVTLVTDAEAKTNLVYTLDGGIAKAEDDYGIQLLGWENYGEYPVFESTEPFVTKVRLYPETATVGKGEKFQFTANVDGRYDYSWAINWSLEPQSELPGTFIDKNGVVHIDANETITSFTVMAKSKANGGVADGSVLTIGAKDTRPYPVGAGTKADPYLIRNEADFVSFTNAVIGGENYKDKYFKQTCDLDLADYPGYTGMGSNGRFYGTYDGAGHITNLKIDKASSSGSNYNLFPYTFGTIMNLGTTGMVKNAHSSGGICRSLRAADGDYGPGLIINCWSNVDVSGNYGGGIVPTNSGKVINCAAFGNVEFGFTDGWGGAIGMGTTVNCFFTDSDYDSSTGSTKVSEADAKATLYATLNANRESAASEAGLSVSDLVYWKNNGDAYPSLTVLYEDNGSVTEFAILPDGAEIPKNDGRQLALSTSDIANTDVTWTITTAGTHSGTTVDKYGYIFVDANETNTALTVRATLKADTSVYDEAAFTVVKSAVPDGSKENPYIIASEADFLKFTKAVIGGEQYKDKYFLQTRNLDMAGYPGYVGMGSNGKFYGTYNGGGHVINVALETDQGCLFPYTWGTIMNLGSTGYLKNVGSAGGIARSLRESDSTGGPGKIINCWSSADVSGNYAGGMAPTARGDTIIANCYFIGTVAWTDAGVGGVISSGAKRYNNYFVNDNYSSSDGVTKLTEAQMKSELASLLNSNLASSAAKAGVDASLLMKWRSVHNSNPIHGVLADVDGTGDIDFIDITSALTLFANPSSKPSDYKAVLDMDGDGSVTLLDVTLLIKYVTQTAK